MSETENVTAAVEPYVINSYGVSNQLLSEGAALVRGKRPPPCCVHYGRQRQVGDGSRAAA